MLHRGNIHFGDNIPTGLTNPFKNMFGSLGAFLDILKTEGFIQVRKQKRVAIQCDPVTQAVLRKSLETGQYHKAVNWFLKLKKTDF